MDIISSLSIITCSYNTPDVLETMLKSFRARHPQLGSMNILIMENSTNDKTQQMLDSNNITYIKNPGGTHSKSLDIAFEKCTTPYALVVDSDIVFQADITDLYCLFRQIRADLGGIECGSRGGFNLKTRMHPWFMLVNIDSVKRHSIRFHDEARIKATHSEGFYTNVPINAINTPLFMYDVGATFYEDMKDAGLKVVNLPLTSEYFFHAEGLSWQRKSGNESYEYRGGLISELYLTLTDKFKLVDIKGFYNGTSRTADAPENEFLTPQKQEQLAIIPFCKHISKLAGQKNVSNAVDFYDLNRHYFKSVTEDLENIDRLIQTLR